MFTMTRHAMSQVSECFDDWTAVMEEIEAGPLIEVVLGLTGESICHIALSAGQDAYPIVKDGRVITVLAEGMETHTTLGVKTLLEGEAR